MYRVSVFLSIFLSLFSPIVAASDRDDDVLESYLVYKQDEYWPKTYKLVRSRRAIQEYSRNNLSYEIWRLIDVENDQVVAANLPDRVEVSSDYKTVVFCGTVYIISLLLKMYF